MKCKHATVLSSGVCYYCGTSGLNCDIQPIDDWKTDLTQVGYRKELRDRLFTSLQAPSNFWLAVDRISGQQRKIPEDLRQMSGVNT